MKYIERKPSLEDAVRLASEGFCRPVTQALIDDVAQHLEVADFCVCYEDEGNLIGYQIFHTPIPHLLYIGGTLITPAYQGRGIKAEATRSILCMRPELTWISGRTQSPIVWSSVHRIAKELLPNYDPDVCSHEAEELRHQLAFILGMNDPIHEGFYGGALYGKKPTHHDWKIQAWWDSICNFERGDAVLYMARV